MTYHILGLSAQGSALALCLSYGVQNTNIPTFNQTHERITALTCRATDNKRLLVIRYRTDIMSLWG